jgi:hypothetical protein
VGLCYVLLPALLMNIHGTLGAMVNTDSGFFATDGTFHDLLPPLFFLLEPSEPVPFPSSALESVT